MWKQEEKTNCDISQKMPRTSTRTRNINANGRPTALSEQDTNSPNIINNIKQRSNIKTNHLAKAGGQIGKSLSNIAIYQDGSENNSENQIIQKNNNQAKSPGRKRGPKGRFVSPNRVSTKSTECQVGPEMKDFQVQVSFYQEMSSPTSSPLPQSQSNSKDKIIESLQNELLLPSADEIEQSTDPKYLKDIIAEQNSQILEQSFKMEQMKLESCQDREIIDKLEEANGALKAQNEGLLRQCEEKDEQIEELLQIAEG